jgi:hypothetical protein
MNPIVQACAFALGLVAAAPAAFAAVVNVDFNPATTRTVQQINPTVTFWQMGQRGRIDVTGFFSDGPAEVSPFLSTADPCGAAQGRFTLFGCGDTFSNPWELTNNDFATSGYLQRIDIALLDGGFVFDVDTPSPGTVNSAAGATFSLLPGLGQNDVITATYSQQVALMGAQPLGDVWGYLSIDLTGITSQGGRGLQTGLQFIADTDPVPVPAALPLLFGALGGLALLRRRRVPG